MKKILMTLGLCLAVLHTKEVVIVTDISVEPSSIGNQQIEGQLTRLLNFNYEGNTYLKFEDKVTMAYIDNKAENASSFFSEPTFDLSMDNFEKFDGHLDNYYNNAGQYIDGILGVNKAKIEISKPKEIVICVDDSSSMTKLTSKLSSTISKIISSIDEKDKVGFVSFSSGGKSRISSLTDNKNKYKMFSDFRKTPVLNKSTDGAYLADGLNKTSQLFSSNDSEKIVYLITDGVDERNQEYKAIENLINKNVKIIPISIGDQINTTFLTQISFNSKIFSVDNLQIDDLSSIPNIPIFESLHQIFNNNYFTGKDPEKKMYIISTLLQNSANLSVFRKEFDSHKTVVIDFNKNMKSIGYESSLNGVDIQILVLPSDTLANKSKNIRELFKEYLLGLGAKSVSIKQGTFDLD